MSDNQDNAGEAPDLEVKDGRVSMSDARRRVALQAAWEIEALSRQVPKIGDQEDIEAMDLAHVLRGTCARIRTLSDVVVGALGDEFAKTEELAAEIR